jgi:minor extracellular protease Epr
MRKPVLISALTFIALLSYIPAGAGPAQHGRSPRKVLIGFKKDSGRQTTESRRSLIRGHGARARRSYRNISAVSAELSDSQISSLRADPDIAYIEEDGLLYALDAELDNSWGVNRIGAGQIHALGNKGADVRIALIDTGIDLDHPDLAVAGNVTFVEDTTDGDDDNGHGTHCAGIIAALDNETGVVGVAPKASIYAVKALDSTGSGYLSDVVAGIDWAIDNDMHIISLSIGTNYDYQTLREACERANAAGIILVAAAGNDYSYRRRGELDTVDYPAKYDSVIAVGAIDDTDTKVYYSSTGPALELTAPGVWISSTYLDGGYAIMSGTSMACSMPQGRLTYLHIRMISP